MRVRERQLTFRGLIIGAVGVMAVAIIAIGMTIYGLRSDATEDAARETSNVATVLAKQATDSIQALDLVLIDLQERIAAMHIATPDEFRSKLYTRELFDLMVDRESRLSQAEVIAIRDDNGNLVNSTRRWPREGSKDISKRDYFRYVRANDDGKVFVSEPVSNVNRGALTIFFVRRINGPGGQFLGLVMVGIPVDYFRRIYGSIESISGESFSLARRDGAVLVHFPEALNGAPEIREESQWFERVAENGGHYRSEADFDGVPRLVTVRPLQDYPLVVSVGLSEDEALANWRRRASFIVAGTTLVLLCAGLLLRALSTQFRRLSNSEATVAEREARLAEKTYELERAHMQIDGALNNMAQGLCMFDAIARLVVVNERYIQMYGLSHDVVRPGCTLAELIDHRAQAGYFVGDPKAYCAEILEMAATRKAHTQLIHTTDGRTIQAVTEFLPDGGWVVTHSDITESRRAEERMTFMARHDGLTGLANRVLFLDRISQALDRLATKGEHFAVLMLDLDQFKQVNDSLGHPVGDALIKAVARRLQAATRETDTVARLGGDEFAILQAFRRDAKESAIQLAHRLLADVSIPYQLDGHQVVVETSIGIALAPHDGANADQLLKNADLALYDAKADGRNTYSFFKGEMESKARLRHALQLDLRNALARSEFEIYYQTIIDAKSQSPCGVEALLRWQHPTRGRVPPDVFIPVAEEIGLIIPLGDWILRKACADAMQWPDHVKVAVNLSAVQFRNIGLVDAVAAALEETGLPPERLELEVTETVLLSKNAQNVAVLHQLKSLGISIVLDDFGTGYSSLSYLQLFPFDKIKIDRSFVGELSNRAECAAIVCAVIGLGRGLNIVTTAEGVETEEQFVLLRAAGCSQAQGYLFSRPCPADELRFDNAPVTVIQQRMGMRSMQNALRSTG